MHVLRTPDHCFKDLPDWPWQPCYTDVEAEDGTVLRIAHIDEGPADAPLVLCMHGQPVWGYLYRKMVPLLLAAGMRVVVPDLVGYGRSDKPAAREDYSYNRQVAWMGQWLAANAFTGITFFGQDWGGLIGLRMVVDQPDRFDRVVVSNTGLPCNPDVPAEVVERVAAFRANAPTPSLQEMGAEIRGGAAAGRAQAETFAYWQKFCWETVDLPIGLMLSNMAERSAQWRMAANLGLRKLGLERFSPLRSAVYKAYEAPFPDPSYKMGPRAMPSCVPTLPTDPALPQQLAAWAFYEQFDKPFICCFTDDDPVTKGGDQPFLKRIPGAQGQAHTTISNGGHFVQERQPEALVRVIVDAVQAG